jgi:hypothetical protein
MITCALCGGQLPISDFCSPRAVLTLHWMSKHQSQWIAIHPEVEQYLGDAS